MQLIKDLQIRHIKEIIKLSKKNKKQLRKLNKDLQRAYTGNDLSKYQLIFQLVFLRDAPEEDV